MQLQGRLQTSCLCPCLGPSHNFRLHRFASSCVSCRVNVGVHTVHMHWLVLGLTQQVENTVWPGNCTEVAATASCTHCMSVSAGGAAAAEDVGPCCGAARCVTDPPPFSCSAPPAATSICTQPSASVTQYSLVSCRGCSCELVKILKHN